MTAQAPETDTLVIHEDKLYLDDAASIERFDLACAYLRVAGVSSATVEIQAAINHPDGRTFTLTEGAGFADFPIYRLYLTWAAQAGEWLKLRRFGDPDKADPARFRWFQPTQLQNVRITEIDADMIVRPWPSGDAEAWPGDLITGYVGTSSTSWQTVHTVTAGKTLTIGHLRLYTTSSNAGYGAQARIMDDGAIEQARIVNHNKSDSLTAWQGVEVPAGWTIEARTSSATYSAVANLYGWEQ